jgi:hypothetical protein
MGWKLIGSILWGFVAGLWDKLQAARNAKRRAELEGFVKSEAEVKVVEKEIEDAGNTAKDTAGTDFGGLV